MQITIKDILTTYWPQTVLLIAAFAFLIKRIFDIQTKKIETKQNIFQQNRNIAITRFMDEYIGLQCLYRQILTKNFDINKITNEKFVKLLDDKYEQLYASYFYFRIFLDPLEQARYADLVTQMNIILEKIIDIPSKLSIENKELLLHELKAFITGKLKENNDNFKLIGQIFRGNVMKHYPIKLK